MSAINTSGGPRDIAKDDPFLLAGLVKDYQIKDWGDQMLK